MQIILDSPVTPNILDPIISPGANNTASLFHQTSIPLCFIHPNLMNSEYKQ
ncbi:MAG TPA: hypothetical protein VLL52_00580 [Anaerolineae bacterium]|nr:hypothetical protein [Anaerolineae bacterium]